MKRWIATTVLIALGITLGTTLTHAQSLMTTPGHFAVSENGAATYTIPIQVPPGTAGMEPKLALSYSSQAGNGLLGIGWSLTGLSSITRCPRTRAQDGAKGGVNFDANDRFCLDGQRLMLVSGTYGASGAEYRTERDSFSKVVSYGAAGNGPAYFKVWTKSGLIMEYGNTADSAIEAQGKSSVLVWANNKVSDTKGNYYTVTYTEDNANGAFYPARIDYTGNTGTGSVSTLSLRMNYEARTDGNMGYVGGARLSVQVRLKSIATFLGEVKSREYGMAYDYGAPSNGSRITSITECVGQNSDSCMPAIVLTWPVDVKGLTAPTYSVPAMSNLFDGAYFNRSSESAYQITGDFNGDGKTDFMWVPYNGDGRWVIAYGTGSGFTLPNYNQPAIPSLFDGVHANRSQSSTYHLTGDFNGDGMTDFMWVPYNGDGRWVIAYGSANGFALPNYNQPAIPNLFDGIYANRSQSAAYQLTGDFNGDGKTDFMWVPYNGDGRWLLAYGAASGFSLPAYSQSAIPNLFDGVYANRSQSSAYHLTGDFNGDGMTDFMWVPFNGDGRWLIAYGAESGFVLPSYSQAAIGNLFDGVYAKRSHSSTYQLTGDFNGDGKTDYMWVPYNGDGRWLVAFGSGNGFTRPSYSSPAIPALFDGVYANRSQSPIYHLTGDFNGDGKTDYMWVPYNGDGRWVIAHGAGDGFALPKYSQPAIPNLFDGVYSNRTGTPGFQITGDFNGDGKTDVMWVPYNGDGRWVIAYAPAGRSSLLSGIDAGNGRSSVFSYQPLTSSSVFTKGSGAVYPLVDLQAPLNVVSSAAIANGIGDNLTTNYKYGGLKVELGTGRGMLGFAWVEETQVNTGTTTRTEYRQDGPYVGLPSRVAVSKVGAGSGGLLKESVNSYACIDPSNAGSGCTIAAGKRYFPYASQSTERSWDLDGSALPSVTTTTAYDCGTAAGVCFGNATMVTVSTSDGASKSTTNTYSNDTANWLLGRLLRSTVTSTTP